MQYLLQPKGAESILQTTEEVERWECGVREHEQRFSETLDDDVICRTTLELAHLEKLCTSQDDVFSTAAEHKQIRPQATLYPWISRWWEKVRKAKAKERKTRATKMRRTRTRTRKGKGKGKNNAKATEYFAEYCLHCKGWGQTMKDCWWNESVRSKRSHISGIFEYACYRHGNRTVDYWNAIAV